MLKFEKTNSELLKSSFYYKKIDRSRTKSPKIEREEKERCALYVVVLRNTMIVAHCAPAGVRLALFRTGFRLEPEKCPSTDTWQFLKGIYCSWVVSWKKDDALVTTE